MSGFWGKKFASAVCNLRNHFTVRRHFASASNLYNSLTDNDVAHFRNLLGETAIKTHEDDLIGYNEDWLKTHKGQSSLVLLPRKDEELSNILKYCSAKRLPCVIQGGNTSLVAGAVPSHDEIVLSMERMNKILSLDEATGILTAEAGCVLQTLEEFVETKGFVMPYDLGAKGSCQIGGNVATNAGGLHFVRYGSLHGTVVGLDVVLANGQQLNLMSTMRKDNTGYDLKQLFIGSEGTLGVITKVAIVCPIRPKHKAVAIYGVDNFTNVLEIYRHLRVNLGEYVNAFEMFDSVSLLAVSHNLKLRPPLNADYPFYVLTELVASDCDHMMGLLESTSAELMSSDLVLDGTFSSDTSTMMKLWAYRERISEALLIDGYCYKYDISVPLAHFYEAVEVVRQRLKPLNATRICGYGHVGDSNLHLNITSREFNKEIKAVLEPWLYEWISERKGSISAEHGLGLKKRNFIHYSKSNEAVTLMKQLKKLFDSNGILNPGKLLPD